ncbi:MAG: carboxypeptidase-like regulatory domain-containing protein [Cryomorphaceae bacterium]|nr:MAG: carboxypeptidase-like regulatory domain-containing protein [Cryomorphaceae bacterium]
MKQLLLILAMIVLFVAPESLRAEQTQEKFRITGRVLDAKGEPLPFVNVYVQGTTRGTTTNNDGRFVLNLDELAEREIAFQFVGYQKQVVKVSPDGMARAEVVVTLRPENIELPQVVISAKGRDPAYAIIKQAQDKRREYLNQVDAYSAEVYMKGNARLEEIPEKRPFLIPKDAMPDSTDLGLIFLSEAVAKYHFQAPNQYKEEMIASKVSGFSQSFSWNRAADVLINFYENTVKVGGISDRGFISPIGAGAMLHYRYKLLGSFIDNGYTVYKIEVTPRRQIDPAFTGKIYITDSLFNIHSLDLSLNKDAGIEFVDSVRIAQTFIPVVPEEAIWMPLSISMRFDFSIFGFKASLSQVAEFSGYDIGRTFERRFFSNETFRVGSDANERDTSYWGTIRPTVLTEEEIRNYEKGDSLERVRSSREFLDSLDRITNKPTVTKFLLTGYEMYRRYDSIRVGINPAISFIQFNNVEGLVIDAEPYFRKILRQSNYQVKANVRYGTASEQFYSQLAYSHLFNYKNYRRIEVQGGHYVSQFNPMEPISPILNTSYALFDKRNFMRLYEKTFGRFSYQQEVVNGVFVQGAMEYAQRNPLFNNTDYTWSGKEDRQLFPNNPPGFPIEQSRALIAEVNVRLRVKQKYETFPHRKRMLGSSWPTIFLSYRKGVAAFDSDVNFDFVGAGISYDLNFGMVGATKFDVDGGAFINNSAMQFYDYQHFNGNQTGFINMPPPSPFFAVDFSRPRLNNFHTLDYYALSTNRAFVKFHVQHHFKGFILNKLPLIRRLQWQTLVGTNFLYSQPMGDYTELYVGIENILKVLRVDFAAQYQSGERIVPVMRIGTSIGL